MGQCDMLRYLEIDELITAEERIEMEKYYDCTNKTSAAYLSSY